MPYQNNYCKICRILSSKCLIDRQLEKGKNKTPEKIIYKFKILHNCSNHRRNYILIL